MISMNFNSYVSLVTFFIGRVLFSFVFKHKNMCTIRLLAVFDFYYRTYFHSQTESENLFRVGLSISFSLGGFSSLLTL